MSPAPKSTFGCLTFALMVASSGCGGTETSASLAQSVIVSVTPRAATLDSGKSLTLQAAVTPTANMMVTWSVVEGSSGGSVTSAGVYTAPSTGGVYRVVATSQANPAASGYATVTVTATPTAQPAATPTFTPAPGVYALAQTVTISSATAGAVIHCTQDGSTPTATSPTCAAPIRVSATTNLKAMATASGYTPSPVASATYTIESLAPTVVEKLQALSTKRQLFAHMSVGHNIFYGSGGVPGGIQKILDDNPTGAVRAASKPSNLAQIATGTWAEYELDTPNADPIGKANEFNTLFRTTFATGGVPGLDYAALKYCFADFPEGVNITPIWAQYQVVMDGLEASYPGRIIYWTVPILAAPDANQAFGNIAREAFNDLVRAKYGPTGRLFDFADMEKHDSNGNLVSVAGIPVMATEWSLDGGHINTTFANKVANAYIDFMYRVAISGAQ